MATNDGPDLGELIASKGHAIKINFVSWVYWRHSPFVVIGHGLSHLEISSLELIQQGPCLWALKAKVMRFWKAICTRLFTMPEIDIILYHDGPLKNPNANKGLPFEGPGIRSYYTQIDRRLKTLDELKTIIMEELCANPAIHSIQITYRMPHEVLKNRINYKYMAIETDKHVKIMFDKLERIPEVSGIELYIQLEPRADDEIQQTATSLQVTVPDAHYEYSTHVDDDVDADDDVNANDDDDDDDDDYGDDDDDDDDDNDDDDYVDEPTAINSEDLVDRDDFEERIDRGDFGDFERDIDDDDTLDGSQPNANNVISVLNMENTIPAYAPPALSFSANTWENMVDPSHVEIPFVSTWREGMNLWKGLTFANKVEVQRALVSCALNENKHFMITRSTTKKLCAKCVDESCKWYVCAVLKPNLHGLWMVTVYVGPHTCIPTGVQNDGRMMTCNFIAADILQKLCEDHTTPVKYLRSMIESKY
ncbi:hypothetical protein SO802_012515 [Lithocarpus litseifolius]|uniref:Transposase MuDR plant domain-containing protein n=1 Tax=Lithocarpus litseifolius TaxID=425828 RepID=A0AAW2D4C7_9ROSI